MLLGEGRRVGVGRVEVGTDAGTSDAAAEKVELAAELLVGAGGVEGTVTGFDPAQPETASDALTTPAATWTAILGGRRIRPR